jgi:hypothetical protein
VTLDLLKRTVTVADIQAESATQYPVTFRIGSITASGVDPLDATHLSAEQIDVADMEIAARSPDPAPWHITYKAPRITAMNLSEHVGLPPSPASSSAIDLYRFALGQLAAISAASISIPSVVGSLEFGGPATFAGDVTYTDVEMQGIKDGKIASAKLASSSFTINTQQAGRPEKLTGNLTDVVGSDIDTTAMAAILDPQKANDDRYYRVYRQISSGAYAITFGQGVRTRIDGVNVEDVELRPSRLQISALLAMMPATGATPTPEQTRKIMETVAGLYEGIRVGNAEMRGLSIDAPQGTSKLSEIRLNLDNGKADFAIEGLDMRPPTGAVRVERFALKSFDIANFFRTTALFTNPAQRPAPDQVLKFLPVLEAIELRGLSVPYQNSGKQVSLDMKLNWGQFVGSMPTTAHVTAKLVTPVDATNPSQSQLVAMGLDTLTIDADLGLAWTEAAKAVVLDPAKIEIGGVGDVSAHASLVNVPQAVFSLDPQQAAAVAAQIDAGPLEATLRDVGGVDLIVQQYARTQHVSPDDARRAIAAAIRARSAPATAAGSDAANPVAANPEAVAILDALARLVEDPKRTLTIKLTPRASAPALQLIQLIQTQPLDALAQFNLEVTTAP